MLASLRPCLITAKHYCPTSQPRSWKIIFWTERWRAFQNVSKIFPSADLIASMYSPSAVHGVLLPFMYRPVNVLLRPKTFSCHSTTVFDELQPPVLRPCTVKISSAFPYSPSSVWGVLIMRGAIRYTYMIRAPRTFLEAYSWSWWRQPHSLAVALPSADRTDQTEGDAVSRAGSSRFDDVAFFVLLCKGTW